jgi:hypothetical protein
MNLEKTAQAVVYILVGMVVIYYGKELLATGQRLLTA